jgi:hypothetical protein
LISPKAPYSAVRQKCLLAQNRVAIPLLLSMRQLLVPGRPFPSRNKVVFSISRFTLGVNHSFLFLVLNQVGIGPLCQVQMATLLQYSQTIHSSRMCQFQVLIFLFYLSRLLTPTRHPSRFCAFFVHSSNTPGRSCAAYAAV